MTTFSEVQHKRITHTDIQTHPHPTQIYRHTQIPHTHMVAHTHRHRHKVTKTLTHPNTKMPSHMHTHPHALSHTHTPSHSLAHTHTLSHRHTLSLSHTHTPPHTFSHIHAHPNTHTYPQSHTYLFLLSPGTRFASSVCSCISITRSALVGWCARLDCCAHWPHTPVSFWPSLLRLHSATYVGWRSWQQKGKKKKHTHKKA